MKQYQYTESYAGRTISIVGTTDTGILSVEGTTVQSNTLVFYLDDEMKFVDMSVRDEEIAPKVSKGIADLKAEIDSIDETDRIFLELDFALDGQVMEPTNFTATQEGAGDDVVFSWDVLPPVENYIFESATLADYSDASQFASGDIASPYGVLFPPGMRYFRLKAQISGMTDSDWATTSLNVQ